MHWIIAVSSGALSKYANFEGHPLPQLVLVVAVTMLCSFYIADPLSLGVCYHPHKALALASSNLAHTHSHWQELK
eukprot:1647120-Amphidinium_carterae.1